MAARYQTGYLVVSPDLTVVLPYPIIRPGFRSIPLSQLYVWPSEYQMPGFDARIMAAQILEICYAARSRRYFRHVYFRFSTHFVAATVASIVREQFRRINTCSLVLTAFVVAFHSKCWHSAPPLLSFYRDLAST